MMSIIQAISGHTYKLNTCIKCHVPPETHELDKYSNNNDNSSLVRQIFLESCFVVQNFFEDRKVCDNSWKNLTFENGKKLILLTTLFICFDLWRSGFFHKNSSYIFAETFQIINNVRFCYGNQIQYFYAQFYESLERDNNLEITYARLFSETLGLSSKQTIVIMTTLPYFGINGTANVFKKFNC